MTKIAVTGGSGRAGRAVVRGLLEHGHDVLNVDRAPSAESYSRDTPAPFLPADLTDFGQALETLSGERMPGIEGADSFNIAAADTVMEVPSRDPMEQVFRKSELPVSTTNGPC